MEAIKEFLKRHSLAINITINIVLLLLCAISYAALIALYYTQGLHLRTFTYIEEGKTIPPTTAIPLLGVLLTGVTSALITRSVEHSLWISLICDKAGSHYSNTALTDDESHQRAQWSVSPFARFLYMLNGQSWILRISGVLLFGTAVLNPVLLYGLRPGIDSFDDVAVSAPSRPMFLGFTTWIDFYGLLDNPTMLASFVSMNNMSAPASSICAGAECSVSARTTSLQAECVASAEDYTGVSKERCSPFGKTVCVTPNNSAGSNFLVSANFTTGSSEKCEHIMASARTAPNADGIQCEGGDFAIISGLWVSGMRNQTMHSVDCRVHVGTATIAQAGGSSPTLDRGSFTKLAKPITYSANWSEGLAQGTDDAFDPNLWRDDRLPWYWQMQYLINDPSFETSPGLRTYNPYHFALASVGPFGNYSMAQYLLGLQNFKGEVLQLTSDTDGVARAIERNFEMATLLAFVREPYAGAVSITTTHKRNVWKYDRNVLAILAVPLLATFLVLCVCWRIKGDEVVVGYDPLEIARRAGEILEKRKRDRRASVSARGTYIAVRRGP